MRPETIEFSLAARLDAAAAPCDVDGAYPRAAMDLLKSEKLTTPEALVEGGMHRLLALLAEVGRGDASVGRLLEGHANALELISRLAPGPLRSRALGAARSGAIYGIWGADPPTERLRARPCGGRISLAGAKAYCSGADGLDAALVLADDEAGGRTLLFVAVDARLGVDRSAWRPLGMRASGSHRVGFDGVTIGLDAVVCTGADYVADPWFSGGAMRFAAVHAGAARGLAEAASGHLVAADRAGAPHQAARLGSAAAALIGLEATLDRAAAAWDAGCTRGAPRCAQASVAAFGHLARVAAEAALLDIADLAQRAVGLGGLIAPHPLERRLRDALTYVRQPNPDGAREAAGRAFADGAFAAPAP